MLSVAASCINPLKKVPRFKALVISSMLDEANAPFMSVLAVITITAGALNKILSFFIGSYLYNLYKLIHRLAYFFKYSVSGVKLASIYSPFLFKAS